MNDTADLFANFFGDDDESFDEHQLDPSDADGFMYRSLWIDSYGFQNHRKAANEAFANLLESEMPQDIRGWDFTKDEACLFKYREIEIRIEMDSKSATFLRSQIIPNRRRPLSRNACDTIQIGLKCILQHLASQISSLQDVAILILRLLEETTYQLSRLRGKPYRKVVGFRKHEAFNPLEVKDWASICASPRGVDLGCIADTAFNILKRTPKQICEEFPEEFHVLHVESVLRADLTARFLNYQAKLRLKFRRRPLEEQAECVPHDHIS